MNCERVRNLLSAYADQELASEEARLIRAHLVTCGACNDEWEAERALKEALGSLESHDAPEDFVPNLLARIAREEPAARRRLPYTVARWAAAGMAAAVLLALPVAHQRLTETRVIEAHQLYRQHALVAAAQPLADRALTSYYYAVAGDRGLAKSAVPAADRVKSVGLSLTE